jgi:hypothetical protein
MMSEPLAVLDFEPHVGEVFALEANGATIPLRLSEARRLGPAMREGGAFALYFAGPPQPLLQQATYLLVHETLGSLDIFIVPLARSEDGVRYEAIFT